MRDRPIRENSGRAHSLPLLRRKTEHVARQINSMVKIRPATPEDAEVVAQMAAALTAHEGRPACLFTAQDFLRNGFGPEAVFSTLIAVSQGEIIGYAIYYPGYDVESASRGLHLADLTAWKVSDNRTLPMMKTKDLASYMLCCNSKICCRKSL